MLSFCAIPERQLAELLCIEQRSNPHPWAVSNLEDGYWHFSHLGGYVGEQLVAFVLYRVALDEAEIIHLVCDKPHQGKGYAAALLQELTQQLRGQAIKDLFLEVREDNVVAKKLYDKIGFESVGRRVNYYEGRHDALIQRLVL